MKLALSVLALLSLGACAMLTGDPVKDCLAARNAVISAQELVSVTTAIASANPNSTRMQQAATLARASLETATATQTAVCPVN